MLLMTRLASLLGARIQEARRSRGWTQAVLAQRAEIDRGLLVELEGGKGSNPTLRVLVSLCAALDVLPSELFELDEGAA